VSNTAGRLYVVATPIGNLGDVTRRAVDVMRSVDGILAEDTRHSRRLLEHLGIDRPLTSLHEHNEDAATRRALARLAAGESLALISDAGTPLVSDPGFVLVRACREAGIEVAAVPGASAVIAALSISGLPTDRFCFEGFPPRRQAARRAAFERLAGAVVTLAFYESAHRILDTLRDMADVFGAQRLAVVARELTKAHETVLRAPLGVLVGRVDADEDQRRGEFVVLVEGAPAADVGTGHEAERVLALLAAELPVRQAAALAARISGGNRNALYRRALDLAKR
jgi:16S rRNA (cytidine1402-2'-O)-methyltransferase